MTAGDLEMLVFHLGTEEYGLELAEVREVAAVSALAPLDSEAAPARGMARIGAEWVAVVSLRERLGEPEAAEREGNQLVVARHPTGLQVALLVDGVRDVVSAAPGSLHPLPAPFGGGHSSAVRSLVRFPDERLVILLAMADLFTPPEVERLTLARPAKATHENHDTDAG